MIDRFERFSFAISDISRYWHKIAADEMEPYGLKGPYAVYFTTLYRYPEGVSAARLAELCSRDKADVSRALTRLEERGLLERTGSTSAYRAPVRLTAEGRHLAALINERARAAVEVGGKGLTEEQRNTFYTALELICANLHTLTEQGL